MANKSYKIDIFDIDALDMLTSNIKNLGEKLQSEEFMTFLGNKCMLELNRISNEKLGGFAEADMSSVEVDKYRKNHNLQIEPNKLIISNDTMADLSHLSEKTLMRYINGFSIAKAIEFGTGILGTPNDDPEWATEVNTNRDYDKGWFYEKDGQLYWSKGFGGKFIYYTLLESVKENISDWVKEYIETLEL